MKKILKIVLLVVVLLFAAIQFVPAERTNPDTGTEIDAPAPVMAVLRRCCYDCHSNDTQWPWYAYVAPMSWLTTDHVKHGREELNFTHWERYDEKRRAKLISECFEEVEEGHMPLPSYLILHGDAKPTDADKEILRSWAETAGRRK